RYAEAADFGDIAPSDVRLLSHHVQAQRGAAELIRVQRAVEITGNAAREVGAKLRLHVLESLHAGNLALLIDDAARRPAAKLNARWSFERVYLLVVEGIAIVAAEVANAVEKKIVARGETANREVVALRTGLARGQADAGNIAQRVAEGGNAFVLHDKLRNHAHALRGFEQRLGKFGHRNRVLLGSGHRDCVPRLDPDHHGRRVLCAIVEAGSVEQQTQSFVFAIESNYAGRLKAGERAIRKRIFHLEAGRPFVISQGFIEGPGGDIE